MDNKFIEEKKKEFEEKYWELKNANDFQENGVSGTYEFGFKLKVGNEIFTYPDWGNIKKFINKALSDAIKYGEEIERKRWREMLSDGLDKLTTSQEEGKI